MPTKTLPIQKGNSCAAHCTAIAVMELDSMAAITATNVESTIWPMMQFKDGPLAKDKNSDPALIASTVPKVWPKIKAKLMCDSSQKDAAMAGVPSQMKGALGELFTRLKAVGTQARITIDEAAYYNCSYTMTSNGSFCGMHNMLVTLEKGRSHFYNPQVARWQVANHWKSITDAGSNFVFAGVAVAIF